MKKAQGDGLIRGMSPPESCSLNTGLLNNVLCASAERAFRETSLQLLKNTFSKIAV